MFLDKFKYLPFLLIITILGINLGLYFTHNLNPGIFTSDLLYLPALYKDIIVNGGSFSNWALTPAPYYFPDMPLYFLSNLLTGNYYYAIAVFFTLQSLLLLYIVYKIYHLFFDNSISLYLAAIIFALIHLFPTPVSGFMFVSAIHYGEFISGLFVIYLVLLVLNSQQLKLLPLFLLFFLVSFTSASDASFSLHFVLPILFSIVVLWAIKRVVSKSMLGLFIVFGAAIWFSKILHQTFSINKDLLAGNNIMALGDLFLVAYREYTFDSMVGISVLAIAFISLLFKERLSFFYDNYSTTTPLMFISLFLLFMSTGILVVLALTPIAIATRYMIPFFEMPILLSPLYLGFLKLIGNKKSTKIFLTVVALLLFIFVLIDGRKKLHHGTVHNDYYLPLTQCVDSFIEETGARNGIATYWNAKPMYMFSKHHLVIAQVHQDLSPDNVISTSAWRQKEYDFAMITNRDMDKNKIIMINGNPDKIYTCQNTEILYYKNKMHTGPIQKVKK